MLLINVVWFDWGVPSKTFVVFSFCPPPSLSFVLFLENGDASALRTSYITIRVLKGERRVKTLGLFNSTSTLRLGLLLDPNTPPPLSLSLSYIKLFKLSASDSLSPASLLSLPIISTVDLLPPLLSFTLLIYYPFCDFSFCSFHSLKLK